MSKELVISTNRHETKVAILEDDQLVEVYFQRANEYSLAGSIHKGRVTRVLPGMQSAFVDLGLERDTFLYVSDFFEENADEYDTAPPAEAQGRRAAARRSPRRAAASSARRLAVEPPAAAIEEPKIEARASGPARCRHAAAGGSPPNEPKSRRGRIGETVADAARAAVAAADADSPIRNTPAT